MIIEWGGRRYNPAICELRKPLNGIHQEPSKNRPPSLNGIEHFAVARLARIFINVPIGLMIWATIFGVGSRISGLLMVGVAIVMLLVILGAAS